MHRKKNLALYKLLAFITLCLFFQGCCMVMPLEIGDIHEIRIKKIELNCITMDLKVSIKNPNNFTVQIQELDLDMKLNSLKCGKLKLLNELAIASKSDTTIDLPVQVTINDFFTGALSLLSIMSNDSVYVVLDGDVAVKAFGISRRLQLNMGKQVDLKMDIKEVNLLNSITNVNSETFF